MGKEEFTVGFGRRFYGALRRALALACTLVLALAAVLFTLAKP